MTKKTEDQESPDNERRFLSTEERVICGQIASSEPPHSSRAQALLAIDEGATHAEASRQSGLTRGQLQYWLGKFRKDRTSIFPIELLNLGQQGEEDSPQSSPDEQELEPTAGVEEVQQESPDAEEMAGPVDNVAAQQKAAPKPKKKSKKKSKKTKKSKKDKKKKKGKKSKKKSK